MPPLLAEPSSCHWSCADRNGKVPRNLDNNDLLKTEIAYNTPIFTAVTRNHGSGQKSRYTAKITVITAIVNSWLSCSPIHHCRPQCVRQGSGPTVSSELVGCRTRCAAASYSSPVCTCVLAASYDCGWFHWRGCLSEKLPRAGSGA